MIPTPRNETPTAFKSIRKADEKIQYLYIGEISAHSYNCEESHSERFVLISALFFFCSEFDTSLKKYITFLALKINCPLNTYFFVTHIMLF